MLDQLLFVAACVAVPILWGIAVNWLFGRLQKPAPTKKPPLKNESVAEEEGESADEPVIEYYI